VSRAPSFAQAAPAAPRRTGEWLALLALLLALLLQLFAAQRTQLAAEARWRPWVERACALAGCVLPAWREPGALSMLARDVIAVPGQPGVLRVQASFRNDARWAQDWPVIALRLSNAEGRVFGQRRFLPRDYLDAAQRATVLAPGQSAQVAFDIVEPDPGAVAFDFRFE
jgi:hypothetical protein